MYFIAINFQRAFFGKSNIEQLKQKMSKTVQFAQFTRFAKQFGEISVINLQKQISQCDEHTILLPQLVSFLT